MTGAWDDAADLVVAGGGGAGLRAALCAAEAGARVILLEKGEALGGKTYLSIGILTASETPQQKRAGIEDTLARHLADLQAMAKAAGRKLDVPLVRFMLEETSKEIGLLTRLGVRFDGPFPEAGHSEPRMHVVQPDCRRLVETLVQACEAARVDLRPGAAATDLILDHKGRVAGVAAESKNGTVRIGAGAVVLAAGDYSANRAFLADVAPDAPLAEPLRDFAMGDGHRMAMRIGAATRNMTQVNTPQLRMIHWPIVEPSPGLFAAGARLVTRDGERVRIKQGPSAVLLDHTDRPVDFFAVIDRAAAKKLATADDDVGPGRDGWKRSGKPFVGTAPGVGYAYLEDCRNWSWHSEVKSVAEAARHIGCPPAKLAKALGRLAPGPLHVLGPCRRVLANSGGGLSTDMKLNVLATDGKPIAGLYGGGVNARLITFMGGHGYALAWAMASGRVAGRNAAAFAKRRR